MATQREWDLRWLRMCKEVASWSQDKSTKCGCVIVDKKNWIVTLGYNGLPRGVDYDDTSIWVDRPEKYFWMEHAERNAIYNAARSMEDCTAYITGPPCMNCARGLVQVRIARVVIPYEHNMGTAKVYVKRWAEECIRSERLFELAGIDYDFVHETHAGKSIINGLPAVCTVPGKKFDG